MNVLELFAGIGGMALGLERAGMTPVGFVEIDPYCRRVLARHWPDVPQHGDVRTAREWWASEPRPVVDVVAGGYPCQPESTAGKRKGTADARWLWPEMARVIYTLKPRWVIGENVAGHRTQGLRFVLRDLDRLGYTARAGLVRACEVGAAHPRSRLFTLAYADRVDEQEGVAEVGGRLGVGTLRPDGHGVHAFGVPEDWLADAPPSAGDPDGVPDWVDRVARLGNAVVPQVAEHIGRIVTAADREIFGAHALG